MTGLFGFSWESDVLAGCVYTNCQNPPVIMIMQTQFDPAYWEERMPPMNAMVVTMCERCSDGYTEGGSVVRKG